MKNNLSGSIINIASIYGVQAPDFGVYENTNMTSPAAYSAIKGGIINLTRYLASYFGEYGIRVNSVSPGGIFDNQNKTFVDNYIKKVPLKRMGKPDDISPAIVFLISDQSRYITGQNMIIDGGLTIV
jgi:NAD(P)-dependent dehydrogenase (short-subunit alcohol dehydrogenase family)